MKLINQRIRNIVRKNLLESMGDYPNVSTSNKRDNLKRYVEDNIDFSGYEDYERIPKSQILGAAVNIFNDEGGWDVKRQGLKKAFIDYIQGLPSFLDIPYYYSEIRHLLYALGYDEVKNMDDHDVSELYYNEIYNVFFDRQRGG